MGSDMQHVLLTLLAIAGSITAFILAIIFIAVPLFRGVGLAIGGVCTSPVFHRDVLSGPLAGLAHSNGTPCVVPAAKFHL